MESLCDSPMLPSGLTDSFRAKISQYFIDFMQSRFEPSSDLYPAIGLDSKIKAEMAIFEMCQFSTLSGLLLSFDPAGLGRLDRNFVFENAATETRELCLPITYQILKDQFNRRLTLLSKPDNIQDHRLCKPPFGSSGESVSE